MSNTSRFTPLYVVKMFLEILYYRHKNIILPQAFLESELNFEEDLHQDLKKIDMIASSGDSKKIIKLVRNDDLLLKELKTPAKYSITTRLSPLLRGHRICLCHDLDTFMQYIETPQLINCDAVSDLIPIRSDIMRGDYYWQSVFSCVFRYILFVKVKHLNLFKSEINFVPSREGGREPLDEMKNDYIFDY